ncbi:MAG: hypothetical protein JSS91_06320 [Bacteroidetes bacterium]|nr:hypothetical protein [Bacteroidota bacterium]
MYKGLIRRCKIMIVTSLFFIIVLGIAMIVYPGGNQFDTNSTHYNFVLNYLSDLGSSHTISGKDNTISKILFVTAFGAFGMILVYFSKIWWAMDLDVINKRVTGYFSKIFLIISGIGFIALAFTPINVFADLHLLFLGSAFISFSIWLILILLLQNSNEKIKLLFSYNLVNLVIIICYLFIIFTFSKPNSEEELEFYTISQMIAFVFTAVNLFIQSVGIMHFLKTTDFRRSGIRNFYV